MAHPRCRRKKVTGRTAIPARERRDRPRSSACPCSWRLADPVPGCPLKKFGAGRFHIRLQPHEVHCRRRRTAQHRLQHQVHATRRPHPSRRPTRPHPPPRAPRSGHLRLPRREDEGRLLLRQILRARPRPAALAWQRPFGHHAGLPEARRGRRGHRRSHRHAQAVSDRGLRFRRPRGTLPARRGPRRPVGDGHAHHRSVPGLRAPGDALRRVLGRRTRIATNTRAVVEAAWPRPIMFFPARHDHWRVQTGDGWAAHVAGAIGVSTDARPPGGARRGSARCRTA